MTIGVTHYLVVAAILLVGPVLPALRKKRDAVALDAGA